nr:PREDICTED: uncharacterized protein LOC109560701 isoform X4 [Bos indicus]XP_019818734.1 PREDICTED: uncharacterized protein LOC109560715 isoform X2 [Bos indicus]
MVKASRKPRKLRKKPSSSRTRASCRPSSFSLSCPKARHPSRPLERTLQKTKTPQHWKSQLNLVPGQRSPGPRPISTSALRPTRGTTPCTAPSTGHETLALPSLSPRNAATTKACRDSRLPGPRGGRPRPAGARGLGLVPTG